MSIILKQGGLGSGGLNFDAKPRRGSVDLIDLFYAHIGAMDTFARGLEVADAIIRDKVLDDFIDERYVSYKSGIGSKIMSGQTSLEELEQYVLDNGEPKMRSGRQ